MLRYILLTVFLFVPVTVSAGTPAEDMAERLFKLHNSPKMQDAIKTQAKRIEQKGSLKKKEDVDTEDQTLPKPLILIFISSSMPEDLLTGLTAEASKLSDNDAAKVIFLVKGTPEEGLKVFGRRINPENHGIVLRVDPFLFNKLEIDKVPIVIVDRMYAILYPSSLKSAINEIVEAGYEDLAQILAY